MLLLKKYDFKSQRRIMVREVLIAFLVLLVFLFCGKYVMQGLNLTTSALSIAGAIVLFFRANARGFSLASGQASKKFVPSVTHAYLYWPRVEEVSKRS